MPDAHFIAQQQQPLFDLPGSEYLTLAPAARIAMSGRRRLRVIPASVSVPASTNSINLNVNIPLETNFTQTSGIYVFSCVQSGRSGTHGKFIHAGTLNSSQSVLR